MKLKLMSYNCKDFNVSKVPFIKSLLERCDILLVQKTWLFSSQFSIFSHFFKDIESHSICGISGVSRILFRGGGVQNFSGKVGVFAWREAPCSAWQSHAFARGVSSPEKILKNGAIWCVLESILLKFCQKNN